MKAFLSTRELAQAIGASESSLRRWTDSGAVGTTRTVGGHRRIPLADAIRFIRETRAVVVRPEVLGLEQPPANQAAPPSLDERFHGSLKSGDAALSRAIITAEYLGGASLAGLCDGPVRSAMQKFGELWRHESDTGILAEHRATDICIGAISHLRQLLPASAPAAPVALGGTPEGDPYLLPSMMAAAVLAECGWHDMNFGPRTPVLLLAQAADKHGAKLVWLSVSFIADKNKLQLEIEQLSKTLMTGGARLIIGGRYAAELDTGRLSNVRIVESMQGLCEMAREIAASAKDTPTSEKGRKANRR